MILRFSDKERQIMEQVRSIIRNENNVEYTEIMPKSVLYFKDLKIQLKEQEVYRKDKRIPLSHQEFLALRLLTEHPGWICTKEQIYDAVYDGKFKEEIDNINKERRLYKLERTIIHSYSRPGWGSGIRRARKRKQAGAVDG